MGQGLRAMWSVTLEKARAASAARPSSAATCKIFYNIFNSWNLSKERLQSITAITSSAILRG